MKFLIVGGYSHANPGDEAILKTTLYQLNDLFPGSTFRIWTSTPEYRVYFDRPLTHELFYWQPLEFKKNPSALRSRLLIKLYTDLYPLLRHVVRAWNGFDRKVEKTMGDIDKVVFIGGGYLNSDFCLLETGYIAAMARRLQKPVYILGQTLGPFKKKQHKKMAAEILDGAETIILRDSDSDREAEGQAGKIWHVADAALDFNPRLLPVDKEPVDRYFETAGAWTFFLGINVRNWMGSRRYYSQIARTLESFSHFIAIGRLKVLFIPMETSNYCDDRDEGREFARHVPADLDYTLVDDALTVEQKYYLVSRLDLFVGMRLHSLVFALATGVPSIGLYHNQYYFRKIAGLFEAFHAEKNALPLDKLEELGPLMRASVLNGKPIRESLLKSKARIVTGQRWMLESLIGEPRASNQFRASHI